MNRLTRKLTFAFTLPFTALFAATAGAEEPPCPFNESRSGLCGYYHSQISPAEAFVNTIVNRGKWNKHDHDERHDRRGKHHKGSPQAVILDVRSTPEYKAGHPEHAYNVPYPYIYQECSDRAPDGACNGGGPRINQTVEDFVSYVESIIPDKDTPIYTLCRTGVRSVGAANVLTDAGYTHVRNVWEGFVGIYLTAPKVQADGSIVTSPVDLNHDNALNDLDKNGWRYHQKLPYDTRLLPKLIYQPMAYLYDLD